MTQAPEKKSPKISESKTKARSVNLVYDTAVRATLERGQREEISQLLAGAKRLQEKYGDLDGLIGALERAVRKAK